VLLINGRRIAHEVRTAMIERGDDNLAPLLADVAQTHGTLTDISDPDQVLFESLANSSATAACYPPPALL
jgi:hypothetical protein